MAPLQFAGGAHLPEVKTPETLVKSGQHWLELAAESLVEASFALDAGDKAAALARVKDLISKAKQAQQDIAEAIAVEAGAL